LKKIKKNMKNLKYSTKKEKCKHKFVFSHWDRFTGPDGIYIERAIVICEKCGEVKIKEI